MKYIKPIDEYMAEYDAEMAREHGAVVEEYKATARDPYYGPYPGGDPRQFEPDEEVNTPEEIEALQEAQAAAERGEYVDEGPQCAFAGNGRVWSRRGFGMVHGDAVEHRVLVRVYADGFKEELI